MATNSRSPDRPEADLALNRSWAARSLALLAAANVALGGVLFTLSPPRVSGAPDVVPAPGLPAQVHSPSDRLAGGHEGEPYVLVLSDADLTALAGYVIARSDVPFDQVRIAVADDGVAVDGVTRGMAVTVPVRAVGRIGARDGLPEVTLDDVSLGGAPLPPFVRRQIVREADRSLDFSRYPMPVSVDAVTLRHAEMTIVGRIARQP